MAPTNLNPIPLSLPPATEANAIAPGASLVEVVERAWERHWNSERWKSLIWMADAIAKDRRERDRFDAQWRDMIGDEKVVDGAYVDRISVPRGYGQMNFSAPMPSLPSVISNRPHFPIIILDLSGRNPSPQAEALAGEIFSALVEVPKFHCKGCLNYHGQRYGENRLICAIHPYGAEESNCPDFDCGSEG